MHFVLSTLTYAPHTHALIFSFHLEAQKLSMTRVTDFGRKRTYLQAGLQSGSADLDTSGADIPTTTIEDTEGTTKTDVDISTNDSGPPKKRRKRVRKKKPQPEECQDAEERADGQSDRETGAQEGRKGPNLPSKKALKKKRWKEQEKEKKQRSESLI
jgi:zinc finger CCHC domain-containing protein 9